MWTYTAIIFAKAHHPKVFGGFNAIIYANDRLLWAVAVGWIVIACHYGYGGWVKSLFSLKLWIPIERMGLSLYLNHVNNMTYHVQLRRQPVELDTITIVRNLI